MGAKRAVPGRSLPYDMLLAAYQKKNQARQQKAAIDANAPALLDDELDELAGPVDSDEERELVMGGVQRGVSGAAPLVSRVMYPVRRKYALVRMKEMLSNAMGGNRSGGLFSVRADSQGSAYPQSAVDGTFAVPSSTPMTAGGMSQGNFRPPSRRTSIDVT